MKILIKILMGEFKMKIRRTTPTNIYDAENPGTIMVGFDCEIPANTSESFEVLLTPLNSANESDFTNKLLVDW